MGGMEFFRTQSKREGGPGILRRRQHVDDLVSFIKSGKHIKPEPQEHPQFQREPNASFIMGSGAAPQRRQATESVLRQTPQINNIGSFTKNINPKRKNEPQKKSNPKNEGIDKFNNIIGNTSTTRRKRKNGLW